MCTDNPAVGMCFNCFCTVASLILFFVLSWYTDWNGTLDPNSIINGGGTASTSNATCSPKDYMNCAPEFVAVFQRLYYCSLAAVFCLVGTCSISALQTHSNCSKLTFVAVPVFGAIFVQCIKQPNRADEKCPREFMAVFVYLGAVGACGAALYFYLR